MLLKLLLSKYKYFKCLAFISDKNFIFVISLTAKSRVSNWLKLILLNIERSLKLLFLRSNFFTPFFDL